MKIRILLLASTLWSGAAVAAPAQSSQLEDLVRKQSALIAELQARVATLEAHEAAAQPKTAIAAASPPSGSAAASPAASSPIVTAATGAPATPNGGAPRIATASERGPVGSVSWSNGGPTFVGPSGATFHVRGRLWLDASNTSGSRYDVRNLTGTEVRSFRLGADGLWGEHLAYKAEVDFGESAVSIKDLYVAWLTKLGSHDLEFYAGNKLGDRGIDDSTPDETMPFQERNQVATGIGPEKGVFGMGLLAKVIGRDWSASANVVGNDANNNPGTKSDNVAYISRVQWTPQIAKGVALHIGATGYHETLSDGGRTLTRSAYDTGHFNDDVRITETAITGATHSNSLQGEAGVIAGPFWAFGEYGKRTIDTLTGNDRHQDALALYGGVFLTGEDANFLGRTGTWTRVRPRHSLGQGGFGAFELLARYETLNLGSAAVAGSGNAYTLSGNWYLNPFSRVMLSYVRWHVDDPVAPLVGRDAGNSVNLRLQTAF